MNSESPYAGIIAWVSVIIINIIVFSIISRPKKWSDEKMSKIILSALVSTTIIHAIIMMIESPGEVIMWIIISFPFIGVISAGSLVMLKFLANSFFKNQE